jgi:hypothetical protein
LRRGAQRGEAFFDNNREPATCRRFSLRERNTLRKANE